MNFDIIFNVNNSRSRLEFVINQYNALKTIDSNNELLKYAGVTSSEIFWAKKYSDEFYERFSIPKLDKPPQITLELNYGIALLEEKDKLAKRTSQI
jgi:hypothetical protein